MKRVYTVGHSNMQLQDFLRLLQSHHIRTLVDIRSMPGSRKFSWFNQEELYPALNAAGISYVWLPVIGGRRGKAYDLVEPVNAGWTVKSFERYANFMLHDEFRRGIRMLESIAENGHTAYMCSEVRFVQCHRRLVSDAMSVRGWEVLHIIPGKNVEQHVVGAFGPKPVVCGCDIRYPGPVQLSLDSLFAPS